MLRQFKLSWMMLSINAERPELSKQVELTLLFQPLPYQDPSTVFGIRTNFALTTYLSAARPIEQALGAERYWTYTACFEENAVAAGSTHLIELASFCIMHSYELCIVCWYDGFFWKQFRKGLNPDSAG